MAQISGNKYILERNENFAEYLSGFGLPENEVKIAVSVVPIVTITIEGDKVTINSDGGIQKNVYSWTLNKEIDDPLPMGFNVKSIATLDGNTLTVQSKSEDGFSGTRTFVFSDTDAVLTMVDNNGKVPSARRFYKRV